MSAARTPQRPGSDPLEPYRRKRNFARTPEPAAEVEAGHVAGQAAGLTYVVQKHWASHLHYDLRLEWGATMKSWALPKGPSLDAKVKRMAVEVEDHPIAYAGFEGTIPARQYGAGKVIVWDRGTWQPVGDPQRGLADGNLKFELRGRKLRGKWVLVRLKAKAKSDSKTERRPAWLLIKEKDAFARPESEYSVVDEMPDRVGLPPEPAPAAAMPPGTPLSKLPATLAPQLASLVEAPPRGMQDWVCEIKFDGYRLLSRVDGADIRLFTRNGNDWTERLPALRTTLAAMRLPPGWYDGEIVMPNAQGVPDFGALQRAFESEQAGSRVGDIVLYLFDLPYFDGHDLRAVALETRRALLQRVLEKSPSDAVRFSQAFEGPLPAMVASACKLGLEGLIAKRRGSHYVSRRSSTWLKLKCKQRQQFAIGGYTAPQGSRSGLGALLLGVHDSDGALHCVGKVGSGFSQRDLRALEGRLAALAAPDSPFVKGSVIEGRPHWVRPTLAADVSFAAWTPGGRIRHAVFHGLFDDQEARPIMRETAPALPTSLRVSHPERVIDASSGLTKLDLVRYYERVGGLMMEHLAGRPVSMLRAPDGVNGGLFFQKHAEAHRLAGMRPLEPPEAAANRAQPPLLSVATAQGLLSAAQWNVIEFHTGNSSGKQLERPDRMVFDLDPGQGVAWPQVLEAAALVHAFLGQLGLKALLKTSGGKGLHLVVPLRRVHDSDTVKGFSQAVVKHLARTIGQRFVAKSGPKNRVGKIFIDWLRNGPGATTVCAWSARARPGLGISVPVAWAELASLRGGDHWTVQTVHARLDQGNRPWQSDGQTAHSLGAAMKLLGYRQ